MVSVSSVPGFDVLGLSGDGSPASSPKQPGGSAPAENPYQKTYDQIQTWSSQYLMQAAEYGAPPIAQFTGGESVDAFAQLTNTLAAIQPALQNGTYGDGSGTNVDTTA